MSKKIQYVKELIRMSRTLANEADIANDRHKEYFDNGFDGAGADPITNQDLVDAELDLTAANVASLITLLQQFGNFVGNVAVVQGDYKATLNVARRADQ